MKHTKSLIFLLLLFVLCFCGCEAKVEIENAAAPAEEIAEPASLSDVTIVYTNDIHSYVYNTKTDEDGNEVPGLRLSNVAALAEDLRAEGKNVLLIDAGDEVQGSAYGSFDKGNSVIEIMNACGFQLSTPGNHDFDYGMDAFFAFTERADYPFISCNFLRADGTQVFPSTETFDVAGTTVAFVGVSTPNTIITSTPVYFQDEDGNYLYTFLGISDANDLYESVQAAVDSVREEADYVIVLGHVGINSDDDAKGISSTAIIENTEGIDAFIDAHSHNTMESELVANKNGEEVLLTQTGAYLTAVGVMTISADGEITTELRTEYENADSEIAEMEEQLNSAVMAQLGQTVAELETTLYIYNPELETQRIVRSMETNAGDFVADAFYWYFNECLRQDCDFVITNGGGVRSQTEAGDINCLDLVNICPFGNQLCIVEATGQEILDALEMGAVVAGTWDTERDVPSEDAAFLHVAGLKYTVDAAVETSVLTDENGYFQSVDGDYRVKDVQVYNRETGAYEPLNLEKTYRVGGLNYILRNSGDGYSMFADNTLVLDFAGQDSDILAQYAKSFAAVDGKAVIRSDTSPLAALDGYALNYENPYGSGRITLENAAF